MPDPRNFTWPDEAVARLVFLWRQEPRFRQEEIADILSREFNFCITRKAIGKKVERLGLSLRKRGGSYANWRPKAPSERTEKTKVIRALISRMIQQGISREDATEKAVEASGFTRDRCVRLWLEENNRLLAHAKDETPGSPLKLTPGHYALDKRSFEIIRRAMAANG